MTLCIIILGNGLKPFPTFYIKALKERYILAYGVAIGMNAKKEEKSPEGAK